VFDRVERGRILEEPAGKHRAPGQRRLGIGVLLDENLNEGSDFRRRFPGQGALAGRDSHHDIAHPARLAGLHHQILRQVVALVEQAKCHDPVLDRRAEFAFYRRARSARRLCHFLGNIGRLGIGTGITLPRTGAQRQQQGNGKA